MFTLFVCILGFSNQLPLPPFILADFLGIGFEDGVKMKGENPATWASVSSEKSACKFSHT